VSGRFSITDATESDVDLILGFIRELAVYEREPEAVVATTEDLRAALFADNPRVHAVICREQQQAIGFALYFYNFSTWLGRHGLYLEDLYVTPARRGCGAGKALLQHLARIAVAQNCGRFEWSVLDWNEPAIRFYESLGAKPQSEWTTYRMTGDPLLALGEQASTESQTS
jgi:GNAT superfamily N-acetyltransferase